MAIEDTDMANRDPESISEAGRTNTLLANTRCNGFCFPCFGNSRQSAAVGLAWWERIRVSEVNSDGKWWSRGFRAVMKVREWSEIVAGPRWKTFIRRFNRNRSAGTRHGKFQYDPLSYALNFDEGSVRNGSQDEEMFGTVISARYAPVAVAPPLTAKSVAFLSSSIKEEAVFG